MKTESIIRPFVPGYIEFRKSLGFKTEQDPYQLNVFEQYLLNMKIASLSQIDSEFVMRLTAHHLQTKGPSTVRAHLKILEHFFEYLERKSLATINPFIDLMRIRPRYFSPYVFSDTEIERILDSIALDVATSKRWSHFLPRLSRYSILFFMARCGLRVSEACRIKVRDVNFKDKTVFIEKTKFYKDRLIPVSSAVLKVFENYLAVRSNMPGHDQSEFLFQSFYRRKYNRKTIGHFFHLKMKELGIYRAPSIKGHIVFGTPCPHSLRHSFAVRTVRRWYKEGLAIDKIADTLATYMGHSCFDYTRIYLKDLSRNPAPLIIHFKYHDHNGN